MVLPNNAAREVFTNPMLNSMDVVDDLTDIVTRAAGKIAFLVCTGSERTSAKQSVAAAAITTWDVKYGNGLGIRDRK